MPVTFMLRMSARCNLRCGPCGQWGERGASALSQGGDAGSELSHEDWKRLFVENRTRIAHIYFWGGEPLLNDGLLDVARYASGQGIITELVTNGTLITERAGGIFDAAFDYINVSLDGPRDINNRIRKGAGDVFQKIISGVETLISLREKSKSPGPIIEILMTLVPENQEYIFDTYEIAKALGADIFHVQFGIFTTPQLERQSAASYYEDFGITPKFWKGFIRDTAGMQPQVIDQQIQRVRRDVRSPSGILYRQTPEFAFDTAEYFFKPEKLLKENTCRVPWQYIQIMSNGDVTLCVDFTDTVAGNIKQEPWADIWNNGTFRRFRRRILKKGIFPASSRCCTYLATDSRFLPLIKRIF
jgi:MoaA/NifB/PqqE/SkfB family radical SAM enzyme